jgi:glutamate dehydrogenase (NAD(P)+)
MVQNFSMYYWEEEAVYERLDKKITAAYHSVLKTSRDYKINMRQAAYTVAVKRVADAIKLRGWV